MKSEYKNKPKRKPAGLESIPQLTRLKTRDQSSNDNKNCIQY